MTYTPAVTSANRVTAGPLGPGHTVMLFDQIVADGRIVYAFVVTVFDNATSEPVLFVTSEVNKRAGPPGVGSHYLGLFPGDGHVNLGASDDWADPAKFFPKALDVAAGHLGIKLPPPPPAGAEQIDR